MSGSHRLSEHYSSCFKNINFLKSWVRQTAFTLHPQLNHRHAFNWSTPKLRVSKCDKKKIVICYWNAFLYLWEDLFSGTQSQPFLVLPEILGGPAPRPLCLWESPHTVKIQRGSLSFLALTQPICFKRVETSQRSWLAQPWCIWVCPWPGGGATGPNGCLFLSLLLLTSFT